MCSPSKCSGYSSMGGKGGPATRRRCATSEELPSCRRAVGSAPPSPSPRAVRRGVGGDGTLGLAAHPATQNAGSP